MKESIQLLEDVLKRNPKEILYQRHLKAHLALKEELKNNTSI